MTLTATLQIDPENRPVTLTIEDRQRYGQITINDAVHVEGGVLLDGITTPLPNGTRLDITISVQE